MKRLLIIEAVVLLILGFQEDIRHGWRFRQWPWRSPFTKPIYTPGKYE